MKKANYLLFILFVSLACSDRLHEDTPLEGTIYQSEAIMAVSQNDVLIDVLGRNDISGKPDITIIQPPEKGDLFKEDSNGVYRYSPIPTFQTGRDNFTFKIEAEQLTWYDSISIQYVKDSSYFHTNMGDTICNYFNFLKRKFIYVNDRITPKSIDLEVNEAVCGEVQLISIEFTSYGQYYGHAELNGYTVTYFPGLDFTAKDVIELRVKYTDGKGEHEKRVPIFVREENCVPTTYPDTSVFHMEQDAHGQIVNTHSGDIFCTPAYDSAEFSLDGLLLSLEQQPVHGTAQMEYYDGFDDPFIVYYPDAQYRGLDSLRYGIEKDGVLYTERHTILVRECVGPEANNDNFGLDEAIDESSLPSGSSTGDGVFFFDIRANDDMCDLTFYKVVLLSEPESGEATIENNLLRYSREQGFTGEVQVKYSLWGSYSPEMPYRRYNSTALATINVQD